MGLWHPWRKAFGGTGGGGGVCRRRLIGASRRDTEFLHGDPSTALLPPSERGRNQPSMPRNQMQCSVAGTFGTPLIFYLFPQDCKKSFLNQMFNLLGTEEHVEHVEHQKTKVA